MDEVEEQIRKGIACKVSYCFVSEERWRQREREQTAIYLTLKSQYIGNVFNKVFFALIRSTQTIFKMLCVSNTKQHFSVLALDFTLATRMNSTFAWMWVVVNMHISILFMFVFAFTIIFALFSVGFFYFQRRRHEIRLYGKCYYCFALKRKWSKSQ